MLPNGVKIIYEFDASNHVTTLTYQNPKGKLLSYSYELDSLGNIARMIEEEPAPLVDHTSYLIAVVPVAIVITAIILIVKRKSR